MSDWQPKVGEECLHGVNVVTPIVLVPDVDGMVVIRCKGEYLIATNDKFKPLSTEEEKLIDSMCDVFEEAACKQSYSMKNGMKALIKAGYRKVEPIDYDDLLNLCTSKSPAYVCDYLIENNHIVVKGE